MISMTPVTRRIIVVVTNGWHVTVLQVARIVSIIISFIAHPSSAGNVHLSRGATVMDWDQFNDARGRLVLSVSRPGLGFPRVK